MTRHNTDFSHLMKRNLVTDSPLSANDVSLGAHNQTKRSDSSITMDAADKGVAYTIDILVGEGQVAVPVLVDTGSADIWVAGNPCNNCTKAAMVNSQIQTTEGCTLRNKGYGSGSVYGCIVSTDVTIGQYHLPDYPLLAATDVEGLNGKLLSGIFGLAMKGIAFDNKPTPVDMMQSSGIISASEVGFYLAREGDGSELVLGNPHSNSHADQGKKAVLPPRGDHGHYRVNLDAFVSQGQIIDPQNTNLQNVEVIVDTGILVSEAMLDPLARALGGEVTDGSLVAPCRGPDKPDEVLGLRFEGVTFNVMWQDLMYKPTTNNETLCTLKIAKTPAEKFIIIGSTFLHNVYHVVNTETGEVTLYGLAN